MRSLFRLLSTARVNSKAIGRTKTSRRKTSRGATSSSAFSWALLFALPRLFTRMPAAIIEPSPSFIVAVTIAHAFLR